MALIVAPRETMLSSARARRPHDNAGGEHELSDRGREKAPAYAAPSAPSGRPLGFSGDKSGPASTSSSWIIPDAPSSKLRASSKSREPKGPLDALGGGLKLSTGEVRLLALLILLACVVRLWRIDRPGSVVFDEVHFGSFASKYIKGTFFMDVHPVLAKLLITFAAFLSGFRGDFDFKDIGKEYAPDHVPYIAMRMLPATLGIALVPLAYMTLRGLACRPTSALLAALFVTFENGLITQSRHILLDSPLLFFTGLTTFCWVGFSNEDAHQSFTKRWWAWLTMTGLGLGAVLSCKWVGLFTVATIGCATVVQLWMLLGDTRISMPLLFRHFVARAICLIGIPILFYMAMFEIHFLILPNSGDGDGFMSSEFQHTLRGHGMEDTYADVAFGSTISIRHVNTQGGYLHSHAHNYPTGSKQQQITLYPHRDDNNNWLVLNHTTPEDGTDARKDGPLRLVDDRLTIRLNHIVSDKKLHSHDHKAPVSDVDWQQEVSGYGFEGFDGDANDHFVVEIEKSKTDRGDAYASTRLRALRSKFRLRHALSGCYLFSHKVKLPDWGFEQQEVTCNKNPSMANSLWYIETSTHPLMDAGADKVNYRKPGFLKKFWELQGVMWRTNAGLTDRHAYDSRPQSWPLLRRGINFWVKDHRQIYLIGNPVVWYLSTLAVLAYISVRGLLILRHKRGYKDFNNSTVVFYDRLCGFLAMGWALHYFPFFIMQRQLFLHHYFPALYFAILLLCSIFDLFTHALKPKFRLQVALVLCLVAIWAYWHWSPLAYAGAWTKSKCESGKLLKTWDFSCNDFKDNYSDYKDMTTTPVIVGPLESGDSAAQPVVEAGPDPFKDNAPAKAADTPVADDASQNAADGKDLDPSPVAEDTPLAAPQPGGDDKDQPAMLPLAPAGATPSSSSAAGVEVQNRAERASDTAVPGVKERYAAAAAKAAAEAPPPPPPPPAGDGEEDVQVVEVEHTVVVESTVTVIEPHVVTVTVEEEDPNATTETVVIEAHERVVVEVPEPRAAPKERKRVQGEVPVGDAPVVRDES